MAKNVLLSSIGLSPAVVTETIDALQKEGHKMDIVVLLSTEDGFTGVNHLKGLTISVTEK